MKNIILLFTLLLFVFVVQGQSIYNNGGNIVSKTGSYWVVGNGNFKFTSHNATNQTTFANLKIKADASLTVTPSSSLTVTGSVDILSATNGLVVQSDATGTGSLIVTGTATGNAKAERFLTGEQWHIVSSPVSGQSILSFLGANPLIFYGAGTGNYGMKDYNETANLWNGLFTNSVSSSMGGGHGQGVWPNAGGGTVSFSGTLQTGNINSTVVRNGYGWNCIGNPYTSAIAINTAAGADNFIALNSGNLDPSYGAIYVWDAVSDAYQIIRLADAAAYAPVGQGFFVRVKTGGSQVNFSSALQTHQPSAIFKSAAISKPEIKLIAKMGNLKRTTTVSFDEAMSRGLDFGYDAGIFKSGFDLYTKLVDNNGVDFGIQCLPLTGYNETEIPIGIESNTQGAVTFSSVISNFPDKYQITFEDRENGTFTPLNQSDSICTIQIAANSKIAGRFYLHTTFMTGTSGIPNADDWKIYSSKGRIIISGPITDQATATLYDLLGREIRVDRLQKGSVNSISSSSLRNGVYLLNIRQAGKSFTKKVPVTN